jgi:putative ATPase
MTSLFEKGAPHPLADRLRPQRLADIVGQDHLLGPEAPIGRMVASRQIASMILWGPPGCGKTTIARLLAHGTDLVFEPLSAVFSGVADLRKVFDAAKKRREMGQGTLLFVDEIHRFNRAQQDAFLPHERWVRALCCLSTRSTASTAPSRMRSCLMSKTAQ